MLVTDPVISNTNILTANTTTTPSNTVDKTTFLKLLVMQMRDQDPLNPMSSENFMGQIAQFNQLEQSINLNDSFDNFMSFQALTQASSLIGKDVQAIYQGDEGNEMVNGKVDEVIFINNTPILKLSSGYEVPIQSVVRVGTDLGG